MKNEWTYTRNGDYLIPDLKLEVNVQKPLGRYGRMRRSFLRENHPIQYNELVLTEKLYPHLREIEETANARMARLMRELLEKNPAPDKKSGQLAWVQHMNSLRAQAEEIILEELIYS
ncbi:MAG: TnpV protein [Lachnospiraceae bacterium]